MVSSPIIHRFNRTQLYIEESGRIEESVEHDCMYVKAWVNHKGTKILLLTLEPPT